MKVLRLSNKMAEMQLCEGSRSCSVREAELVTVDLRDKSATMLQRSRVRGCS
jgi:hypothetical protein